MTSPILTVDLHGCNCYQARVRLNSALRQAGSAVWRIEIIHGCHSGTQLRELAREEYASHPKIRRMDTSDPGKTVWILREF